LDIIKCDHEELDGEDKYKVEGLLRSVALIKIIQHQIDTPAQFRSYRAMKLDLNSNKSKAVIVQDFTQLELASTIVQDLIISIYNTPDEPPTNFHFIAPNSSVHNDIVFVMNAWIQLLNLEILPYSHIEIWSDGGPKHFKISSCMYFFSVLQVIFPKKEISYNFFTSNHGHGVCDAAASHIKNKIRDTEGKNRKPFFNSPQLLSLEIKNHKIFILEKILEPEKGILVSPIRAIRSYVRFLFNKENPGDIVAMRRKGTDEEISSFIVVTDRDENGNSLYFPAIRRHITYTED
jgi:hypothetical protein